MAMYFPTMLKPAISFAAEGIGRVAVLQHLNRKQHDKHSCCDERERAIQVVVPCRHTVLGHVPDVVDADRQEQQQRCCQAGVVPSLAPQVHQDAVARQLHEAEEHDRQTQPDLFRVEDGDDVERIRQRVHRHAVLLVAREAVVVLLLAVEGDIERDRRIARQHVFFKLVGQQRHEAVDEDDLELAVLVAPKSHVEGQRKARDAGEGEGECLVVARQRAEGRRDTAVVEVRADVSREIAARIGERGKTEIGSIGLAGHGQLLSVIACASRRRG